MKTKTYVQGREVTTEDIRLIQQLIDSHPSSLRTQLARELCDHWNWRNDKGQVKDMACLSLLRKLEKQGYFQLPAPQGPGRRNSTRYTVIDVPYATDAVSGRLGSVTPIKIELAETKDNLNLFKCLINSYHYLGWAGTVGENMKYLVFDYRGNPLGCLLFGAAAWACASRDEFIGWNRHDHTPHIHLITNNMRFLILPWVQVRYLASHMLGLIARRISNDWLLKYGHRIYLLETFVEARRFQGISYQAANWIWVGKTEGRGRNDRARNSVTPIKDIYVYPLARTFRRFFVKDE